MAEETVREHNLLIALESRDVIGQAKGILMERHGIDADAAFAMLRDRSQHLNRKLRDIAEELCRTRRLPGGEVTSLLPARLVASDGALVTGRTPVRRRSESRG